MAWSVWEYRNEQDEIYELHVVPCDENYNVRSGHDPYQSCFCHPEVDNEQQVLIIKHNEVH